MMSEEGFGFLENLNLDVAVAEAVAFLFEQTDLHRDAVRPKSCRHAFGLLRRNNTILQSLKKQHRTTDAPSVLQR